MARRYRRLCGLLQSASRLVLLTGQRVLPISNWPPAPFRFRAGFLFTQGEDARCLYLICSGYLKLTTGRKEDRQMIVRVAAQIHARPLCGTLARRLRGSAESLTTAQLRPVERERFLSFLRSHKEAQMRAVQCICQEYGSLCRTRAALRSQKPWRPAGAAAARAGAPDRRAPGGRRIPLSLLLTHEEMAQ